MERQAEALAPYEVDKTVGRSVFLGYAPAPYTPLLSLHVSYVETSQHRLLGPVHLSVQRHDRLFFAGDNGVGKSTLLNLLWRALGERRREGVVYVPQQIGEQASREAVAALRAAPPDVRGRVCQLLAALGVDPGQVLQNSAPSPGEVRKALIGMGLARHVYGLILDEPTNHLDLPATERLEAALEAFLGALVVVTHDRDFARASGLATVWDIHDGDVWTEPLA